MRLWSAYLALAALAGASACAPARAPSGALPSAPPTELAPPVVTERTELSFGLEQHYASVQTGLLVQGLLRDDGGGADTQFDRETLIRTFNEVVFRQEFIRRGDRLVAAGSDASLNRFEVPVTLHVRFGQTVDPAAQINDAAEIDRLVSRLAARSSHAVDVSDFPGNFTVFILHEEERLTLGPRLKEIMPELTEADITAILDMPRNRYCLVVTSDPANDGRLQSAFAIIRAEHPDRLRVSCLHEEISQGLGLQNDSPTARPSIFTDEEEFGRLTSMDELLLTMLYDPRLLPGMTAAEAAPIVEAIATELLPEETGS